MGYSMIFMMPIAANDANVFLAGCDGSLPGMQVFLCRKARSFLYHGRKWPVRKSKYIEGHFHTIREQPALSPGISPKRDFTSSLLMSCWGMVAVPQSSTPSIRTIQGCMALFEN